MNQNKSNQKTLDFPLDNGTDTRSRNFESSPNVKALPNGWKWVKLGEVSDKITDGTHFKPQYENEGVAFISVKDINDSKVSFKNCKYISKQAHQDLIKRCHPEEGDILITKSGTIGRLAIVPKLPEFSLFVSVALIKHNRAFLDSKYLIYCLENHITHLDINQHIKGGLLKNYHLEDLRLAQIQLPPLSIQAQIVEKLEALLSELDKGKAQLLTAQAQLKTYRQAVLKFAFEGKLTGDVEGWKSLKTGDIMEKINNGYTPKSQFLSEGQGEIPFIKVYNLNFNGTLNFTKNPTFIPKDIHEKELKRSICYPDDVLINIVGPPLGKVSVVPKQFPEWNINQAIVLFRPNEKIIPKFLAYFLLNPTTINWLEGTSKATAGQWNVKVSTCREIPINLPPLSTQQKIVTEIESRLSVCDKLEDTLKVSVAQSETLRQSLLKRAFEGRLV